LKRLSVILLLIFAGWNLIAQDVHHSQFNSSLFMYNPAMTGQNQKYFTAGLNYRNQWNVYKTFSFFMDKSICQDFLDRDKWGIGLFFFNDKAGDGDLKTTEAALSSSYSKCLNADQSLFFSLGASVGWVSKSISYDNLQFLSQYTGLTYDPTLPPDLSGAGNSSNYVDFNGGCLLDYHPFSKTGFSLGYSLNHINKPIYTFMNTDQRLPWKSVFHGSISTKINRSLEMEPFIYYSKQEVSDELLIGTQFSFLISKLEYHSKHPTKNIVKYITLQRKDKEDFYFLSGAMVRTTPFRDFVAFIGFDYNKYYFTISYDANINTGKEIIKRRSGIEFSFIKKLPGRKKYNEFGNFD